MQCGYTSLLKPVFTCHIDPRYKVIELSRGPIKKPPSPTWKSHNVSVSDAIPEKSKEIDNTFLQSLRYDSEGCERKEYIRATMINSTPCTYKYININPSINQFLSKHFIKQGDLPQYCNYYVYSSRLDIFNDEPILITIAFHPCSFLHNAFFKITLRVPHGESVVCRHMNLHIKKLSQIYDVASNVRKLFCYVRKIDKRLSDYLVKPRESPRIR